MYCAPAPAQTRATIGGGGIRVRSGDVRVAIGGRLQVDAAAFDDDRVTLRDDIGIRRARVKVGARIGDRIALAADYDVVGLATGWRNLWANYRLTDRIDLRGGNFTVPFSMEDLASSTNTTFMERALPNALAPGFGLGGQARYVGREWTVSAGYFGSAISEDSEAVVSSGSGVAGRITATPIRGKRRLLHIGIATERRSFGAKDTDRVRSRPEAGLGGGRLLDTGTLRDTTGRHSLLAEAAWIDGPLSLQGGYVATRLSRPGRADPTFEGGYVQGAWVVTGERRAYSRASGTIGGLRPGSDLGAVEIAGRVSMLDLDDEGVTGGREWNVTLGANWYIGRNFRVMVNATRAQATPNRNEDRDSVTFIQSRVQVVF